MKVLTIVHNTVCSGAAKSLLNLLIGLKGKNIDIKVIVPSDGYLCRELEIANIPFFIIPFRLSAYPNSETLIDKIKFFPRIIMMGVLNLIAIIKIHLISKEFKPDIIHSNVSVINIGYFVAKINRIKHVWHIREYGDIDFNIKPFPSKKIKQRRLKEKSYTISITKDIANYFSLGSKNKVIYNGIVNNEPTPINRKKDKVILFVGSISENKGVPLIIKTFIKFHKIHPDYKLQLIGEGDAQFISNQRNIITNNNLNDSILFLGYQKDVYPYMQRAKALIVASKKEGFGRITAEAMANGCMVIGMNTGGTKEQFDNGKNILNREIGLRYTTETELLGALDYITDMDEKEYNSVVKDAQYVVSKLYSKKNNIENTYNFFSDILNK